MPAPTVDERHADLEGHLPAWLERVAHRTRADVDRWLEAGLTLRAAINQLAVEAREGRPLAVQATPDARPIERPDTNTTANATTNTNSTSMTSNPDANRDELIDYCFHSPHTHGSRAAWAALSTDALIANGVRITKRQAANKPGDLERWETLVANVAGVDDDDADEQETPRPLGASPSPAPTGDLPAHLEPWLEIVKRTMHA